MRYFCNNCIKIYAFQCGSIDFLFCSYVSMGFDINPTRYSKPERQILIATDKETSAILKILGVKTDDRFSEMKKAVITHSFYLHQSRRLLFTIRISLSNWRSETASAAT